MLLRIEGEAESRVRDICKQGFEGGGGERGEKRVEYVEGEMDEGVWVYRE